MKIQALALALALALAASFSLTAGAFAQTPNSTPAATAAKSVHKAKTVHAKTVTKAGSPEAVKK